MGNMGSCSGGSNSSRRHGTHNSHPALPPPQPPQPEIAENSYIFAAATPYPHHYPNPDPPLYYEYSGYYPPPPLPPFMPVPLPASYDHHRHAHPAAHANWFGGGYPCGPVPPPLAPYVEHQKAVTIRNDVNLRKDTLTVEPDEQNPGRFLVAFNFDAAVAGRITITFFAKEDADCNLTPVKENLHEPVTVSFQQCLSQKFRQPSGTGIDFSMFEETELTKVGDMEVYPVALKAEAFPIDRNGSEAGNSMPETTNSQITLAVFEKEKGEYQVRVVKQILYVNRTRYELQEIYGIGNSVNGDIDGNDPGKECVICLTEPWDTTVLPCRHMCMCSSCAKVLRFQTDRCPICRQPVERLLEIKINNSPDD